MFAKTKGQFLIFILRCAFAILDTADLFCGTFSPLIYMTLLFPGTSPNFLAFSFAACLGDPLYSFNKYLWRWTLELQWWVEYSPCPHGVYRAKERRANQVITQITIKHYGVCRVLGERVGGPLCVHLRSGTHLGAIHHTVRPLLFSMGFWWMNAYSS